MVNKLIWKCILLSLWPYSNHKVHIPILLLAFEISTAPFELFRNLNSIWEQIIPIRCNKYCFIQLIRRIICQGCALLWNYRRNAFSSFQLAKPRRQMFQAWNVLLIMQKSIRNKSGNFRVGFECKGVNFDTFMSHLTMFLCLKIYICVSENLYFCVWKFEK